MTTRAEWRDWALAVEAPRYEAEREERWQQVLRYIYRGAQQASPEAIAQMNMLLHA